MRSTEILFEPLPIGRIGIRARDKVVIAVQDFSCLGRLLEEYICHGAVSIVMPSSVPEAKVLDQMPSLLAKRIKIVDDSKEREAVERLLYGVRREFDVRITEDSGLLHFPKGTAFEIFNHVSQVHDDVKRLAMGFNHGIQIELSLDSSKRALRYLRKVVPDSNTRIVLSQLECLLNEYSEVAFDSHSPKSDTPSQLVTIFDKLVNDAEYLAYSDSIASLALPDSRPGALAKLKEIRQVGLSKKVVETGWDYFAKVMKVWTGVPLPESKELAVLVRDRTLPPALDMSSARIKAIEMWKSSDLTATPLRRDGSPIADGHIVWVPPLESMKVTSPDDRSFSLGTVDELLAALNNIGFDAEVDKCADA